MIERFAARVTRNPVTGIWEAVVGLRVNGRNHGVRFTVDEMAIREELASRRMGEGASAGFFKALGKWLSKTAKKVAKWKVWKTIGKVVKAVVNNPIVAGIVGVASTIFPPIGATYVAAKSAISVVEKVASGDAKVLKNVGTIAQAAAKNNPLAAQAVDALKAAQSSPLAKFIPA